MNFMVAYRNQMRMRKKSKQIIYHQWCFLWYFLVTLIFSLDRLAEKKATIGYTYEDSTVTQPEPQSDKDEDNSENSESEEDEGIPDIGKY